MTKAEPSSTLILEEVLVPGGLDDLRAANTAFVLMEALPTKSSARKAAKRGHLLLDGEPCRWSSPVIEGQRLSLLERSDDNRIVLELPLEVVYEDDWMAIVSKPAGLPVNRFLQRTLDNALPFNLSQSELPGRFRRPRPVHRLDARTTGLLAIAKTAAALARLSKQFEHRTVFKRYRAIVNGRLEGEGTVELPIDERAAISRYRASAYTHSLYSDWTTTVDLWPETGRKHQLRLHMASLGHPILGDGRYGGPLRGKGLFLQAVELHLDHPDTGERLRFETPELPRFGTFRAREDRRWAKYHPEDA